MWEWIQTWTFFNWLAVIAFAIALVGLSNATLSLKSRFVDWKAVRDKGQLKKRLLVLEQEAFIAGKSKEQPTFLLIQLKIHETVIIKTLVLMSLGTLAISGLMLRSGAQSKDIFSLVAMISTFMLSLIYYHCSEIERRIKHVYNPEEIISNAGTLIQKARDLGIISESDISTVVQLVEAKRVKDSKEIFEKIKKDLPEELLKQPPVDK